MSTYPAPLAWFAVGGDPDHFAHLIGDHVWIETRAEAVSCLKTYLQQIIEYERREQPAMVKAAQGLAWQLATALQLPPILVE